MEAQEVPPQVVFVLAVLALASLWEWIKLAVGWRRGMPAVAAEPHEPVKWGGAEVVGLLLLFFVFQGIARGLVFGAYGLDSGVELETLDSKTIASLLAANGAAMVLVVVSGVLWFRWAGARKLADFGVSLVPEVLLRDVGLAWRAFLLALLPVYVLQSVLVQFVPEQHVVLKLIREQPAPLILLAAGFTVVFAAPLVEEFLFRLTLQGWLEKVERRRITARQAAHAPVEAELSSAAPENENPYVSPHVAAPQAGPKSLRQGFVPVLASSTIFAVLHAGAGAAPVSLMPLALILGYLYLRTGRLLPCVLTHAIFNGFNLGLLLMTIK